MPEVHLLQAFALLFLLPDVLPYHLLVSPSEVEPLICHTFAASPAERGNSYLGLWKGLLLGKDLIPSPTDQNPWAHWRNPMDMMRQG
jgi:hypothetical protein